MSKKLPNHLKKVTRGFSTTKELSAWLDRLGENDSRSFSNTVETILLRFMKDNPNIRSIKQAKVDPNFTKREFYDLETGKTYKESA